MIEYINGYDVANEIRMSRAIHKGTFLIVEGPSDSKVFRKLLDLKECQLIIGYGKEKTISAIKILEEEIFPGVLAIVDRDFWGLEDITPSSVNLFITDTHDLETTILASPALESVVYEFGSERKIESFLSEDINNLRNILLENGSYIGYLRWISIRDCINLDFDNLSFKKFIDTDTLELDVLQLIKNVIIKSQRHDLSCKEIETLINQEKSDSHDKWQLCCGHDLVCILSIGFRKAIGTCKAGKVKIEIIERSLRLAYEFEFFTKTKLYKDICNWEKINSPFKVF